MADVTPVHKKDSKSAKSNYRPVNILSSISKVQEWIMFKQLSEYFRDFFSNYHCRFWKGLVHSFV